eukprot:10728457-Alexandrium_andersonii.AAC.1
MARVEGFINCCSHLNKQMFWHDARPFLPSRHDRIRLASLGLRYGGSREKEGCAVVGAQSRHIVAMA